MNKKYYRIREDIYASKSIFYPQWRYKRFDPWQCFDGNVKSVSAFDTFKAATDFITADKIKGDDNLVTRKYHKIW